MEEPRLPPPTAHAFEPTTFPVVVPQASPPSPPVTAAAPAKSGASSKVPAMRKVPRSMMTSWKLRHIQEAQGGICPLSLKTFDRANMHDWCIDHDHITGEIRGVLYRSANAVEGKVKNAVARWGGTGEDYSQIIPYLERLVAYLKAPGTGMMYAMHKTPDERKDARNLKAREARAAVAAKRAMLARQRKEK